MVSFLAGSTPEEIEQALEFFREHESDCQSSWYDSETARKVELKPFRLDKTEATNERFRKFVAATGHVTEAEKRSYLYGPTHMDRRNRPAIRERRLRAIDGRKVSTGNIRKGRGAR